MTTMIREVYEALKEAGASEEKSAAAAEAIEGVRESERFRRLEAEISELKGEVNLIKWMLGFNLAVSTAVLFKLLL
ncbi:MAG: integrase [Pseudomonadota bacterium]|nr:integrase [Pseudomonadota bacterium]